MSVNIKSKCENCFREGICNYQKEYTDYTIQALNIAPIEYNKSTTVYSSNIETKRETNLDICCRDFIDIRVSIDIIAQLCYLKELLDSDDLDNAVGRIEDMIDLIENEAVIIRYEENYEE